MSCGCKAGGAVTVGVAPQWMQQTRAGMCLSCPHLPGDEGLERPCPLNTSLVALSIAVAHEASTCREDRWPGTDGQVSWKRRRWLGVPDLLRWRVLLRLGREGKLPGCGCDARLKASKAGTWLDPWMRISGEARGAVARIMQGWKDTREAMKA